jgi:hypothetical protein
MKKVLQIPVTESTNERPDQKSPVCGCKTVTTGHASILQTEIVKLGPLMIFNHTKGFFPTRASVIVSVHDLN